MFDSTCRKLEVVRLYSVTCEESITSISKKILRKALFKKLYPVVEDSNRLCVVSNRFGEIYMIMFMISAFSWKIQNFLDVSWITMKLSLIWVDIEACKTCVYGQKKVTWNSYRCCLICSCNVYWRAVDTSTSHAWAINVLKNKIRQKLPSLLMLHEWFCQFAKSHTKVTGDRRSFSTYALSRPSFATDKVCTCQVNTNNTP